MLRRVKAGTDILNIESDGTLALVAKPFSISERPDGKADLRITAGSLKEIEKLIPNIAAALKISEVQLREQLAQAQISMIERRPDTVHFSLSFGGQDAIRSAAKACLVLWTTLVGNDETASAPYDAVRAYIHEGDDVFNSTRTQLDSRPLDEAEIVAKKYGPLFNLVYVRSNALGRGIGHFTLYDAIGFQIVLAEKGGSPNKRIALASNSLFPAIWSDKAAEEFDIPYDWLDAPDYSDELPPQERIIAIMRHYLHIMMPKEIGRICDDVFRKHNLKENENIPEELRDRIISEISHRVAKHALSLAHEEKVPAEQKQEIFLSPFLRTKNKQ